MCFKSEARSEPFRLYGGDQAAIGGATSSVVVDGGTFDPRRDGTARNNVRTQGKVSSFGGSRIGATELSGSEVRRFSFLSARHLHGHHLNCLDVQNCQANTSGENSMSAFLGTVWFICLVGAAGFVAGLIFKKPFLKLITGGKYAG